MILEPVLGEGGYYPAPAAFLRGLREICDEHGILFIADEVQCGFARTGHMFFVEESGIRPDILVMAKGIASGFPFAAIGASAELMARWPTGSHGGTYGGNPMGCAAALATIDVLTRDGFLDNVNARGEQLRDGLRKVAAEHPVVADVRGPGLMVAMEFRDPATGEPDAGPHRGGDRPLPRPREPAADERRHVGQHHPVHAAAGGGRGRDGRWRVDAVAAAVAATA